MDEQLTLWEVTDEEEPADPAEPDPDEPEGL